MPIQRFGVTKRYADCVIHGGLVYLVEVPGNPGGDIVDQTKSLLMRVDTLLQQVGSSKSRLLMVTLYLADMADYEAMNSIWDAWIPLGHAPARACVQAVLADSQWRLEIVLTATVN